MKRILLRALITAFIILALSGSAALAAASDCSLCHNTVITDFDLAPIVKTQTCTTCHNGGGHAYWYDSNGYMFYSTYVKDLGYYKYPETVNSPPSTLHLAHSGQNALAGNDRCFKCHGVVSCNSCHNNVTHTGHSTTAFTAPTFLQANGSAYVNSSSSCAISECHQKMPFVKRTNVNGSQLCVNCHPRFGATAADTSGHNTIATASTHTIVLPGVLSFTSGQQQVDCSGCHVNNLATEHSNRNQDCAVCHNNPINPAAVSVVKDANGISTAKSCEACHFNIGVIPAPEEHILFHIATASNNLNVTGGPHISCNTCHSRTTPVSVAVTVNGTVYQKSLAQLAAMTTKEYSCLGCHNGTGVSGSNPKAPVHRADYNGQQMAIMDVHSNCASCHAQGTTYAATINSIVSTGRSSSYSCTECHTSLSTGHKAGFEGVVYQDTTAFHLKCTDCHNTAYKPTVETLKDKVKLGIGYDCSACHSIAGTMGTSPYYPKHQAGNDGIVNFHPLSCDTCHKTVNGVFNLNLDGFRSKLPAPGYACTDCHNGTTTQSGLTANTPLHRATDDNGTLYSDTTSLHPSCATCHDSNDFVVNGVIDTNSGTVTPYQCADCHTGGLTPEHNAAWTNGTMYGTVQFHRDCAQCHSSSVAGVGTKIHEINTALGSGTIASYNCAECHGSVVPQAKHSAKISVTDTVYLESTQYHLKLTANAEDSCFQCHTNSVVAADLATIQAKVKSGSTYSCTDCHNNPGSAPYQPNHNAVLGTETLNTVNEHPACTTCHTTAADSSIRNLKGQTGYACEACHTNLTAKHQSTDNLGSTLNMVNCSWCHSSTETEFATNNLIGVHIKPNIPLTKEYTCNVCHSAASPVKVQISAKQTNCDACHNGISAPIRHPDSQYYPKHVVSNYPAFMPEYSPNCNTCHTSSSVITLHTAASVGCTTCHFTEAYKPAVVSLNPDCAGCHTTAVNPAMDMAASHKPFHEADTTLYPQTAECLNCHAKDSTADGQSLLGVHKKNSASAVTCDSCHSPNASQAVKTAVTANNVSCQACHVNTTGGHEHPVAVSGYDSSPAVDCSRCHATGNDGTAELAAIHQKAADAGLIANYSCATCHNTTFEGAGKPIAKDGSIDMKQDGITAIYCASCHNGTLAEAPGAKYPAHDGNHINSAGYGIYRGTYNGTAFDDSGADCSKCHTSLETKVVHDTAVNPNVNCNSCHQSSNTAVQAVITGAWSRTAAKASYTCSDCHNTLPYLHQKDHLAAGQDEVTCNVCHDNGVHVAGSFNAPNGTAVDVSGTGIHPSCNKCHSTANSTVQSFILDRKGQTDPAYNCEACHDTITPKHNKLHTVNTYLNNGNADCSGCHSTEVTVTHAGAAAGCDACHSSAPALENTKTVIFANLSSNPARTGYTCQSCHVNAAQGHNHQVAANGYDASPAVDCSKCHSTATGGAAELAAIHQNAANAGLIASYSCNTCHNATFEGAGKPISKDGNIDMKQNGTSAIYCAACHNGTLADAPGTKYPEHGGTHRLASDYGAYTWETGVNCSGCHTNMSVAPVHDNAVPQDITCGSCHNSSNTAVSSVIAANMSRNTAQPGFTCADCHNTLSSGKHAYEHTATSTDAGNLYCAGCHSASSWTGSNAQVAGVHQDNCDTCHASTNSVVSTFIAGKAGQANTVYNCEGCHTTGGAAAKEAVHQPEHLAKHGAASMDCFGCHGFTATAGTAVDIKSAAIHKAGCGTCHSAGTRSDVKLLIASRVGQANAVYNCEDCHGTIHLGWENKHKPAFPSDQNMNCANCHNNYLPTEHTRYFSTGGSGGTTDPNSNVAYKVFRSNDGTNWSQAGTTTGTTFSVGSLVPSTNYWFRVQAYDGAGNLSGYSNTASATTKAAPVSSGSVTTHNPDYAQWGKNIDADRSYDRNIESTVTNTLKDNSDGSNVEIREDGDSDKWVYVKLNKDARDYSRIQVKLRFRWTDSDNYGNILIYPYQSDQKNINTGGVVDFKMSKPSTSFTWYEIDVTNAAHAMDGFGWIKFRIKPGNDGGKKRAELSEVRFILETQGSTGTETSVTTPSTTVPEDTSGTDTVPPTDPAGLAAVAFNSAQVDLSWTASTDSNGSSGDTKSGEAQTCNLCHSSTARSDVKTAVSNKNANCSACHTIHGDITTVHTAPAYGFSGYTWDCAKCHTKVLSDEHANRGLNCSTCHDSTKAKVQAAIQSTVTDGSNRHCSTCHTGTADGAGNIHTDLNSPHLTGIFPTATDNDCLNCHLTQKADFVSTKGAYHVVSNLTSKASGLGKYVSPWTSTSKVGCQGCHGSSTAGGTTAYAKILKKPYTYTSHSGQADMLCFLCHDRTTYGYGGSSSGSTGFSEGGKNLHNIGDHKINNVVQCSWCHASVPHATSKAHLVVTKSEPNSQGNLLTNYYHPSSGNYSKRSCGSDSNACDDHRGY